MKACSVKWVVCFCGSLWVWSAWWPRWQTCSPRCFGEPIAENSCYFVSALSASFSASSLSQRWKFLVSPTCHHVCDLNLACILSKMKPTSPLRFTASLLILREALCYAAVQQHSSPIPTLGKWHLKKENVSKCTSKVHQANSCWPAVSGQC